MLRVMVRVSVSELLLEVLKGCSTWVVSVGEEVFEVIYLA